MLSENVRMMSADAVDADLVPARVVRWRMLAHAQRLAEVEV